MRVNFEVEMSNVFSFEMQTHVAAFVTIVEYITPWNCK